MSLPDSLSLPVVPVDPPFVLPASVSLDAQNNQFNLDVDPQILEALRSKDRIYVLKLGELMEALINDRRRVAILLQALVESHLVCRPRIELTPASSYQRLLVHRCSAFYRLTPEADPVTKSIFVASTNESRIPPRKLSDLVPAEAPTAPAFKIMRRSPPDRRSIRSQSQAGSVAGDDADFSDVEPSESGSLGGRSITTGRNKSRMTIEEREAAYNEARSRIFMGFEEKEKEKDLSASSSSLSLVSASASTSGGGGSNVASDLDESVGSPVTEGEFSGSTGPNGREKKDSRQLGRNSSASSSSRSLRSGPSYNSGPNSSRNSRASSPSSFSFPNIYDPNPLPIYDPSQPPPQHGYHPGHYMYPYIPPGQPAHPYIGAYPYYPYHYQSPHPLNQHSTSDPPTPSTGDSYMSPHGAYPHPYGWPPMQSPPHMQQHPAQLPPPHPHSSAPPPPVHNPPYPYMPPQHAYTYPIPSYYPLPPGPPLESPPAPVNQNVYDPPRSLNGNVMGHQGGHSSPGRNGGGTGSTQGNGRSNRHNGANGFRGRGAPPMNQGRAAWSYGPGVSQGGHVTSPTETIGPRLNNSRRTSNNSTASSATSRSSNCDDVSSTASSSTTSSSSRRTYTSTTSSQHPLPARPDWAVGLKPQPTLHATPRHHDHSHSNSRTMSPISAPHSLNGNGGHQHQHHNQHHTNHAPTGNSPSPNNTSPGQQRQPVPLQSPTEFPPLSSSSAVSSTPEKRVHVVSGAWGNTSSTRSIRVLSPVANSNALVHHPSNGSNANTNTPAEGAGPIVGTTNGTTTNGNSNGVEVHLEETDHAFERPPPKSSELFNPKVLRRPASGKVLQQPEKEKEYPAVTSRGDVISSAILVEQVEALALVDAPEGQAAAMAV